MIAAKLAPRTALANGARWARFVGWVLGLLLACALCASVRWHEELRAWILPRQDVGWYVLFALLLAIPARFTALAAAYVLELLFVGWSRSSLRLLRRPDASVKLDILAILVTLLVPSRHLGYLLSLGLLYLVDLYGLRHLNLSLTPLLPLWIFQTLCLLLLQSCVQYWLHRLHHSVPALWALHQFHHSAERMSLLTSARQTELTRGVEAIFFVLPAALLTTPTAAFPTADSPMFLVALVILVYQVFVLINGYLCHSSLTTGYGWLGRWLIVSPRMHRLHHAAAARYHDRNFGFDLVIWDRLFGTYIECEPEVDLNNLALGLETNHFNRRGTLAGILREYFVTTYLLLWNELRDSWRSRHHGAQMPFGEH